MSYPIDGAAMREFDVGGVHIDRCDSCRGLWFDPGELITVLAITGPAPTKQADPEKWRDATEATTHIVDIAFNSTGDLLEGAGDIAGDILSAIAEFIGGAISL